MSAKQSGYFSEREAQQRLELALKGRNEYVFPTLESSLPFDESGFVPRAGKIIDRAPACGVLLQHLIKAAIRSN